MREMAVASAKIVVLTAIRRDRGDGGLADPSEAVLRVDTSAL
jgi:hypothetical protein